MTKDIAPKDFLVSVFSFGCKIGRDRPWRYIFDLFPKNEPWIPHVCSCWLHKKERVLPVRFTLEQHQYVMRGKYHNYLFDAWIGQCPVCETIYWNLKYDKHRTQQHSPPRNQLPYS